MEFGARITGTGVNFPKRRFTNDDIAREVAACGQKTSDVWIRERTGIIERRFSDLSDPAEHNSSMGAAAAMQALEMAGKKPGDIDQILYATCSADTKLPSSACWVQEKIGASRAWAMDLNAACSGFVYGLVTAEKFIQAGDVQTALVIGGEVLSPYIDWQDRSSCILFGDGAGAAVVERVPVDSTRRILSSRLLSDGSLWELLHVPGGGSRVEITPEIYPQKLHKIRMNGREIFKVAVRTLSEFAETLLAKNNLTVDSLDWFVPHQANRRIIDAVVRRVGLSWDKVILNLDRYGNTSAATVPTALDMAVRDGRIQTGQTVLMDVFGAGLTYGAVLMRW
jgi:3-oxoacyl-[acyl-carrier-protein] synthase-3